YELRQDVASAPAPASAATVSTAAGEPSSHAQPKRVVIERGVDSTVEIDIGAPVAQQQGAGPGVGRGDAARPPTPAAAPPPPPAPPAPSSTPASVFALPYRMLFAVATMDTVTIHDTQQAGPVCMFTKLHYDEFTDMAWLVFFFFLVFSFHIYMC